MKYLKDLNREVIAILNSSTSVQEKKEFEFKDLIGKKFTFFSPILKDKSQTEYYESLSNFKMRKMPLKVPFAIEEIVSQGFSNYYRLKFKGDKVGYIDTFLFAEDLEFMNYKCSNCESVGMPSVEILREASKKAVWSDIFKKEGISKGSYVWLKYSRFDLPWLTKMIIKDYKLNDETLPLELELLFEVDGNEMQSSLYTPELNDLFYVSDPAPRIAKWGKRVLTAIKDNKVFIGMTKEQVRASWGLSDDINRTVGPWGVHEQWIYENNSAYLYFQNDKLTSWQD